MFLFKNSRTVYKMLQRLASALILSSLISSLAVFDPEQLVQMLSSTCPDDGPVIHEDHQVGVLHKLDAVGAKDPGLAPEQLRDALLHEVAGDVGVDGSQRVVQEVDVFVLRDTANLGQALRTFTEDLWGKTGALDHLSGEDGL